MPTTLSGSVNSSSDQATMLTLTLPPLFDDSSRAVQFERNILVSSRRSLYDQKILDMLPPDIRTTPYDSFTRRDERTEIALTCVSGSTKPPLHFHFQTTLLPPPFPGVLPIFFHTEDNLEVGGTYQPAFSSLLVLISQIRSRLATLYGVVGFTLLLEVGVNRNAEQ